MGRRNLTLNSATTLLKALHVVKTCNYYDSSIDTLKFVASVQGKSIALTIDSYMHFHYTHLKVKYRLPWLCVLNKCAPDSKSVVQS